MNLENRILQDYGNLSKDEILLLIDESVEKYLLSNNIYNDFNIIITDSIVEGRYVNYIYNIEIKEENNE